MADWFGKAQKYVLEALDDEGSKGIILVAPRGRSRTRFVTWSIEEIVAAENDGLRALVVASTNKRIKQIRKDIVGQRAHEGLRPLSLFSFTSGTVPPFKPKEANFITPDNLIRRKELLPPDSFELLIVEEPDFNSAQLKHAASKVGALFTIVITLTLPPPAWAWSDLGDPKDCRP